MGHASLAQDTDRKDIALQDDEAKVSTELFIVEGGNHGIAGAGHPPAVKRATAFMREHLGADLKE